MKVMEKGEMELLLTVDPHGRILGGSFRGEDIPKEIIRGRILVIGCPEDEDEPAKPCMIVQGMFCCIPPPPRCPGYRPKKSKM